MIIKVKNVCLVKKQKKKVIRMDIKKKLFDKTWKKCIFIFLIVFLLIVVGGSLSINYLHDVVTNSHVHTESITVIDKLYGDNPYSDYYLIIGDNNKTYSIVNHDDGYGREMFNNIKVGQTYKIVVKEPELIDINQFPHIMQVYGNDTG